MIALPDEQVKWGCDQEACWLCGEVLGLTTAVVWVGADGVAIQFHPACSGSLGMQLIADSREAQLAGGGGIWTRRAARAAGAALRAAAWEPAS